MPRKTNPYQNDLGFVTCRDNSFTGGHCILYDSHKTGEDQPYRWTVICSSHDTREWVSTKKAALLLLSHPASWCENCAHIAEMEHAEYLLNLRPTRSDREQWRMLASLAIGDSEKSRLFEEVTGETPDHFLLMPKRAMKMN